MHIRVCVCVYWRCTGPQITSNNNKEISKKREGETWRVEMEWKRPTIDDVYLHLYRVRVSVVIKGTFVNAPISIWIFLDLFLVPIHLKYTLFSVLLFPFILRFSFIWMEKPQFIAWTRREKEKDSFWMPLFVALYFA